MIYQRLDGIFEQLLFESLYLQVVIGFQYFLETDLFFSVVLWLDVIKHSLYLRVLFLIMRLLLVDIKLMEMVLDTNGFGSLHFLSYIRQ